MGFTVCLNNKTEVFTTSLFVANIRLPFNHIKKFIVVLNQVLTTKATDLEVETEEGNKMHSSLSPSWISKDSGVGNSIDNSDNDIYEEPNEGNKINTVESNILDGEAKITVVEDVDASLLVSGTQNMLTSVAKSHGISKPTRSTEDEITTTQHLNERLSNLKRKKSDVTSLKAEYVTVDGADIGDDDNNSTSTNETCKGEELEKKAKRMKILLEKANKRCAVPLNVVAKNPSECVNGLDAWLKQFQTWNARERLTAMENLIGLCHSEQVKHIMNIIEPQFRRDFISLLPKELALYVLTFLQPQEILQASQTCRYWKQLADDNILWRRKCEEANIPEAYVTQLKGRMNVSSMSLWKAALLRQHKIEMNWRSGPVTEMRMLKGHDDHVITCLQFSGNRVVSGSDDNTLKVWSVSSGKCLRTLVGHSGGVWSSQMSDRFIVSGSTDRTLRVWDIETGHCIHTLYGHTSTVRCLHLHGNVVVSGSRDATLRMWDIENGVCIHILTGHIAAVRCVQYDGRLVVSGAYDYTVKVWDPEKEICLHTLTGHTNRVYSLQFDGVHVVSGSLDTSIKVWDVETGTLKHTLMGHQSLTSGMELRNNILVSGNADSTVKVWDIITGKCLQTLSGSHKHQSAVTCLQFNCKFVITSSDDGTVKLWDVKTGRFIRNLVQLSSGGSGGVVWRIRADETKLVCAVGSRNGTEETKLLVLDFDTDFFGCHSKEESPVPSP